MLAHTYNHDTQPCMLIGFVDPHKLSVTLDAYLAMTRCPNVVGNTPCKGGLIPVPPEDDEKDELILGCPECGMKVSHEEHGQKVSAAMSEFMQEMLSDMGGMAAIQTVSKEQQYEQALKSIKHMLKYFPPCNVTPSSLLTSLQENAW